MKNKFIDFFKQNWWILIIFALLVARNLFYNSIINIVHSPDLGYHIFLSDIYRQNPKTIFFWNVDDIQIGCHNNKSIDSRVLLNPFLYHSVIGKIWFLTEKLGEGSAYQITSLIQSIFGLLTIFYVYLLAKLITKNKLIHLLSVIIIANLPMFSFISNYLSYDNLINLLSIMSIYYFFKYLKEKNPKNLILLGIFMMLGGLTKIAFGPLILILLFLLLINKKFNLTFLVKDFIAGFKNKKNLITVSFFILISVLFISFYGRNLLLFNKILPNRISFRLVSCPIEKVKINLNTKDKLAIKEETTNSENIKEIIKKTPKKPLSFLSYFKKWQITMMAHSVNIVSHRSLVKDDWINKFYYIGIYISILAIILQIIKRNKTVINLFLIGFLYTAYYFYHIYSSYKKSLIFEAAVQGRYVFPIIGALIVATSYSLLQPIKNKILKILIVLIISAFLIYFDFFWFLSHYKTWYSLPPLKLF